VNQGVEANAIKGDPDVIRKLGVKQKGRTLRRWLGRLIPVAILLGIAAGLVVWRTRGNTPKQPSFVTAPVQMGDLRETVTATGTLSPLDSVEVGAEVTGRVTKVHVDINDRVQQNQVLVEIDTEQLSARVEESGAQLSSAQAAHRNARATATEAEAKAQRARELHKLGLTSAQDLETAEAALARAKAGVASAVAQITVAQAGLKSTKTSLGKAIIRSPSTGSCWRAAWKRVRPLPPASRHPFCSLWHAI
jgi:HlyD family secretion protein